MHGKKPTREQRKVLQKWSLSTTDWLVAKDTSTEMILIHRFSDTKKTIYKERVER